MDPTEYILAKKNQKQNLEKKSEQIKQKIVNLSNKTAQIRSIIIKTHNNNIRQ